ncbi:MAG: arginine--tRNA ligase [Alphaproteobacteria bacterium 40-19]|nr:MAG: arginine--tRNA ligase [Alphaproteobacteria bacterium 40-19]
MPQDVTLQEKLSGCVAAFLKDLGYTEAFPEFLPCLQEDHGDLTTRAAFQWAKQWKKPLPEVTFLLKQALESHDLVQEVQVASGYVNVKIKPKFWHEILKDILQKGQNYGYHHWGQKQKINLEYVSANPTGPFHAGHSRGAILGDALAGLLKAVGYDVTKEFYVNDAGQQVAALGHSVYAYYVQVFYPERTFQTQYPGPHIQELGYKLAQQYGDKWVDQPAEQWLSLFSEFAVKENLRSIRRDLEALGVFHDVFTYESTLHAQHKIEEAVDLLEKKGLVYQGFLPPPTKEEEGQWNPEELLLLKTTEFGDAMDRPLRRMEGGSWTYFAADIAYHQDKKERGFDKAIDVWGADHASHVTRMQAAVKAVTGQENFLEVFLCQMVQFFDEGVLVKMSKRKGQFVSVADILESVDKDVLRFFMLTKKASTHLNVDFHEMRCQTKDNPIFYIQYAHARCCSVMNAAAKMFSVEERQNIQWADYASLSEMAMKLIKMLADFPRQVSAAAVAREPHLLASYLYNLAGQFHGLWQQGRVDASLRFLIPDQLSSSLAYLSLVQATALVIRNGLDILGIEAKEEL